MQKTAYELRISDWSSGVFSSDLDTGAHQRVLHHIGDGLVALDDPAQDFRIEGQAEVARPARQRHLAVRAEHLVVAHAAGGAGKLEDALVLLGDQDRKSTRLNSSH